MLVLAALLLSALCVPSVPVPVPLDFVSRSPARKSHFPVFHPSFFSLCSCLVHVNVYFWQTTISSSIGPSAGTLLKSLVYVCNVLRTSSCSFFACLFGLDFVKSFVFIKQVVGSLSVGLSRLENNAFLSISLERNIKELAFPRAANLNLSRFPPAVRKANFGPVKQAQMACFDFQPIYFGVLGSNGIGN